MAERSVGSSHEEPQMRAAGHQQALQLIPALRTQLDYDMVALLGIRQSFDLFGGMRGISGARAAQFDAFSRGEVGSISGYGLSEGNLRRLQERSGEARAYGIMVDVDIEGRRFEITNTNYAPISAMTPEEHATLVLAVKTAQDYLMKAEGLKSQGREGEAAEYVARALQVQEIYSYYVEGLMGRGAAQEAYAQMEKAPRAGGSERVARDLVEMATGVRVQDGQLAAEFERVTGVSYGDFIVREVGGEYVGAGIAGVARHNYSESVMYANAGIGALNAALQMVYDGTSISGIQDYQQLVSSAAQNFAYAGGLADAANSIMRNVYHMVAARNGARSMDSVSVEELLAITREVRPGAEEMERAGAEPRVTVRETERVMVEGAFRHFNSLEAERRSIAKEYAAAESESRGAALYRMIVPRSQEEGVEYAHKSEQAEARAMGHFSEAEAKTAHLQNRVVSILSYEPVWQAINSNEYTTSLQLADASGLLVEERDRIAGKLDQAMRDGTAVEGLDVQLRGLDYRRMAAAWEKYRFPEVAGERARAGLERLRDGLVGDLREAAASGTKLEGLERRKAALGAAEAECINFEQAVWNAAGRVQAAAHSLRNGINENNERVSAVLRDMPDEVAYHEEGRGDMAGRDVRIDLRGNKRIISGRMEALGRYSEELAAHEREIGGWVEHTLRSYEPSLVLQNSNTLDLEERYGIGDSAYFAGLREIDSKVRDIGAKAGASAAILRDAARQIASEYRQALEDAQQAAQSASGIDLADPFSWAMGGALFRGVQLGWRAMQAAWAGITERAAQEGALALAARAAELTARAVPTAGTIAQNSYAAYRMAGAENFDEFMEGATWIGALGSTGGLVGAVGRGARYLSIAADSIAITAMVAGIGYQAYRAFERGGEEWWDLARVGGMGALGMLGAGLGLAGTMRMRVPGGFRDILPSGLISGRVIPPGEVSRALEGGRAFGEAAGEIPLRPMAPMEREQVLAVRRAAEDSAAVRNLEREFSAFQSNPAAYLQSIPGGMERGPPAEIAALARIKQEHPEWNATQVAVSYVETLRARGAEIPAHLLSGMAGPAAARAGVPGAVVSGREATELMPSPAAGEVARAATMSAEGLRAVQEARAVETLVSEYEHYRNGFGRGFALFRSPEIIVMENIINANPGMTVRQAAREYVARVRETGIQLPQRLIAEPTAVSDVAREGMRRAPQEAPPQELPPIVFPQSPQASADEIMAALERLGSADHRRYIALHFSKRQPSQAALENALAIFGKREGVVGDFRAVIKAESVGGNAGAGHVAVNGYMDESGRIIAFGNLQFMPREILERGIPFSLRIEGRTGRISEVMLKRHAPEIPESLSSLLGMQVEPPWIVPGVARRSSEAFAPTIALSTEVVERHSTIFSREEITYIWENLQRGIFVTPRAGTEAQAKLLYEDFIMAAARQAPGGEVNGILIRGDMSGVGVGNELLGAPFMDRTIMMRMRGVREEIMETAERLGIEGITPIFTRRPGRSDEFMVAIFGPRDSVTANAGRFLRALREAPSERIARICREERFGGRSFMEAAAEALENPESITKFKFDYAPFTASASTPRGFLDKAAGRAMMNGSAAHTEAVAGVLGMARTDLLFIPSRSIGRMNPGREASGAAFDVSFRMPPAVQREVEAALGREVFPRLGEMLSMRMLTQKEMKAIQSSIAANGGRLPLDDAARYLFRKGIGQALSGEERVRFLNSLVGEERFNPYATIVDEAIARYAAENGIQVSRPTSAPAMQYLIGGIGGADLARHREGLQRAIYDALSAEGVRLIPDVRAFETPHGLTAESMDAFLSAQRCGGMRTSAWMAGEFVVTAFGSGNPSFKEYILSLVPEQSRASMMEIMETIRGGRGITKLNDLYEVLRRTDPALYENFVRIIGNPEFLDGLVRIMPGERANALRVLMGLSF